MLGSTGLTLEYANMLKRAYISDYVQVAHACFLHLSEAISSLQEGFTPRSQYTRD